MSEQAVLVLDGIVGLSLRYRPERLWLSMARYVTEQ
jgi:hypothetical protein